MPVYGVVPPLALIDNEVDPPLQLILPSVELIESSEGSVILTDLEAVQPFASVTK